MHPLCSLRQTVRPASAPDAEIAAQEDAMGRSAWVLGGMISVGLAIAIGPPDRSIAQTAPPPAQAPLGPICSATDPSATDPSAALPKTVAQWAEGARLFGGLGNFHRKASTRSAEAQAYF